MSYRGFEIKKEHSAYVVRDRGMFVVSSDTQREACKEVDAIVDKGEDNGMG